MRARARKFLPLAVFIWITLCGCQKQNTGIEPDVARFVNAKEAQVLTFARERDVDVPRTVKELFAALRSDDFNRATNTFAQLQALLAGVTPNQTAIGSAVTSVQGQLEKAGLRASNGEAIPGPVWHALFDAYWSYYISKTCDRNQLEFFANEIFRAVPSNSVFVAGPDPARFTISAKCADVSAGIPFFVISQNQFIDERYLDYLELTYSNRLQGPDPTLLDQVRQVWSRPTTNLYTDLARLNTELLADLLRHNPNRTFYISPRPALTGAYAQLVPHGPVFLLNPQPVPNLSDEVILTDQKYWATFCGLLIGADWISETTSVTEICDFVERTYVKQDLEYFRGNPSYVSDRYSQSLFSGMRYYFADMYWWRIGFQPAPTDKRRMQTQAQIAFKQAFALGPGDAQTAYHFGWFLQEIRAYGDAARVLRIGLNFNPGHVGLQNKLREVEALSQSAGTEKN